ncbi:hypothetical protein RclHR1_08690010 [Rhizophagus clarus]|uniref:Uncharacterized protein n=1 Tax=Rhizophagus clarus TaxID=94130 RepID=A0A2Z6SNR3_9GLOM|nr:hypothetical protein RclHR1_08690010 [Rhizophagus clarus]
MSSSSNSNLILSTVFTVGFIVGGVVVRFVGVNDSKESQQQILIDDIENDQEEKEIDDDDITLVSCKYRCKSHFSKSSFSSSSSIASLYSSYSSLSNPSLSEFITSPDSSNSFISTYDLITKLNQLRTYQKNLYKKQQTFYSDKISYNHQYNCLITEINVFKDYSHLQISKSNEKLDFCRQNIKSLQSSFLKGISTLEKINISEINNNMKFQLAEMKWLENFNEIYKEKLDNYYMKNLDEMKRKFNDYEQKTLKEIEDLKYNIEELKCEIGVCDDEETIKEIRQELKFGELTNLLYENGFIET